MVPSFFFDDNAPINDGKPQRRVSKNDFVAALMHSSSMTLPDGAARYLTPLFFARWTLSGNGKNASLEHATPSNRLACSARSSALSGVHRLSINLSKNVYCPNAEGLPSRASTHVLDVFTPRPMSQYDVFVIRSWRHGKVTAHQRRRHRSCHHRPRTYFVRYGQGNGLDSNSSRPRTPISALS